MKKQVKNKYLERYKTTADVSSMFLKGTSSKHNPDRIPSYHGSGRIEYKRILPPLRDPLDINENLFREIMHEVCPQFNIVDLKLNHGICAG